MTKNSVKTAQEKTENVRKKIIALRLKRSYSCENMATGLEITAPAYRKIETGETSLSVERLFKIAEILKQSVSYFLEADENVFTQTNNDHSSGYQYQQKIENFYQENREVYERLIASKDEQIKLLENMLGKRLYQVDSEQ